MDKRPGIVSTRNEKGNYDHEYNSAAKEFYDGANPDKWRNGREICNIHKEFLRKIPIKSIETIIEIE